VVGRAAVTICEPQTKDYFTWVRLSYDCGVSAGASIGAKFWRLLEIPWSMKYTLQGSPS